MLVLDLALDSDTYSARAPIIATLTLRCLEATARVVNTRLAPNSRLAPPRLREVLFDLAGSSGTPLKLKARINAGYPRAADFQQLQPGDVVERQYPLHRFYDLSQPGQYSLQAVYHNQSDPEDGRTAWKEELRSNSVSFVITGAPTETTPSSEER